MLYEFRKLCKGNRATKNVKRFFHQILRHASFSTLCDYIAVYVSVSIMKNLKTEQTAKILVLKLHR